MLDSTQTACCLETSHCFSPRAATFYTRANSQKHFPERQYPAESTCAGFENSATLPRILRGKVCCKKTASSHHWPVSCALHTLDLEALGAGKYAVEGSVSASGTTLRN